MEQNQDTLNNITQFQNRNASAAKKFWKTPELRIMPVPTGTQAGKYFVDPNKENSLYRPKS